MRPSEELTPSPFKVRLIANAFLLCVIAVVGGCGDSVISWREEVRLLDGRVITVVQKRRIEEGKMPREAWLSFKLPDISDQEIVWHENLETQVLNVSRGKLYLVGVPFTEEAFRQYGRPYPEYVSFRYERGIWVRVAFSEIPEEIYDTNMYFENMALHRLDFVSLEDKNKMLKNDGYLAGQKRLTAAFKTPH